MRKRFKLKRNIPMSFWKRQKSYSVLRRGKNWTNNTGNGYRYPKF